jgi:hypothetical protein
MRRPNESRDCTPGCAAALKNQRWRVGGGAVKTGLGKQAFPRQRRCCPWFGGCRVGCTRFTVDFSACPMGRTGGSGRNRDSDNCNPERPVPPSRSFLVEHAGQEPPATSDSIFSASRTDTLHSNSKLCRSSSGSPKSQAARKPVWTIHVQTRGWAIGFEVDQPARAHCRLGGTPALEISGLAHVNKKTGDVRCNISGGFDWESSTRGHGFCGDGRTCISYIQPIVPWKVPSRRFGSVSVNSSC